MLLLRDYLRTRQRAWFEWGVNDGATFLADWVVNLGHADPLASWRGYGERQAKRAIVDAGGVEPLARATFAAFPEIDPAAAMSGDIALGKLEGVDPELGPCGLIRAGAYWAGLMTPGGVLLAPAVEIVVAWRV